MGLTEKDYQILFRLIKNMGTENLQQFVENIDRGSVLNRNTCTKEEKRERAREIHIGLLCENLLNGIKKRDQKQELARNKHACQSLIKQVKKHKSALDALDQYLQAGDSKEIIIHYLVANDQERQRIIKHINNLSKIKPHLEFLKTLIQKMDAKNFQEFANEMKQKIAKDNDLETKPKTESNQNVRPKAFKRQLSSRTRRSEEDIPVRKLRLAVSEGNHSRSRVSEVVMRELHKKITEFLPDTEITNTNRAVLIFYINANEQVRTDTMREIAGQMVKTDELTAGHVVWTIAQPMVEGLLREIYTDNTDFQALFNSKFSINDDDRKSVLLAFLISSEEEKRRVLLKMYDQQQGAAAAEQPKGALNELVNWAMEEHPNATKAFTNAAKDAAKIVKAKVPEIAGNLLQKFGKFALTAETKLTGTTAEQIDVSSFLAVIKELFYLTDDDKIMINLNALVREERFNLLLLDQDWSCYKNATAIYETLNQQSQQRQ